MTENTIFMTENKLLKRKLANEQLRLYCKYYKKNPLTAHHCDSRATSLEKLYSIDISARDRVNFFPESVDLCLNDMCRMTNAIREKEHDIIYVTEGLIKTYPIEKAVSTYKQWFDDNVDSRLKDSKLSDVVKKHAGTKSLDDKMDFKIKDIVEHHAFSDDSTQPGILTFLVPLTEDQIDELSAEDMIKDLAHSMYRCGYNLAQYELVEFDEDFLQDMFYDVVFFYVTFEAKYTDIDFDLSDNLYHVTPMRNLSKICKNGLVPKSKHAVYQYPERVYLFNDCDMLFILDYAMSKAEDVHDSQFAMLKLSSERLQQDPQYKNGKLKFYVDQKYYTGDNGLPQAIYTYGNVKRGLIDDEIVLFKTDGVKILDKKKARLDDFK